MSVLHDKINSYALERGIEFDETYSLTPTRTGTATYNTSSKSGTGTIVYNSGNGPVGGAGSWSFPLATAAARFNFVDTTSYITDGDYSGGFWCKFTGTLTSNGTLMQFGAVGTNQVGTAVIIGGSGTDRFIFRNGSSAETAYGPTWNADEWYYVAVRRLGTSGLEIYINGTNYGTLANSNTAGTGGHTIIFGSNNTTATASGTEVSICNFHVGPSSLFTEAVIKEIYNTGIGIAAIDAEPMTVTTSVAMMPTIVAAQTVSYGASPMTVDATFADPILALDFGTTTVYPMEANPSSFVMPTITAVNVVNISVSADPMTASAELHMPEANIGDSHISASLDASALFVMPVVLIINNNTYSASPMTATATAPSSTVATELIGTARVEPMIVSAMAPMPPAYRSLTDDMWYNRMYSGHSIRINETDGGVNSARAFLKLFNDVTANKTGSNIESNRLLNNLPDKFVTNNQEGSESSSFFARALNDFYSTKTPALTIGSYDDYERKAVRFENISFDPRIDSREISANARLGYSLEFSFKTTKSNQIIARGESQSTYTRAVQYSTIGLLDGKLYGMKHVYEGSSPVTSNILSHPDNFALYKANSTTGNPPELLVGNKRIDDGQWHHVVIQYGLDERIQYWIDGKLDIQSYGSGPRVRPRVLGFNSDTERYQSDFYTSGWSFDPGAFLSERDITLHYNSYQNYLPIQPEAIVGGIADMGQEVTTRGNRAKALMLYFWPTDVPNISGTNLGNTVNPSYDLAQSTTGSGDPLDQPTWFPLGTTYGPQTWYDLDLYPVDVTGKYVSLAVKQEKYKNIRTVRTANRGQTPWQESDGFKDPVTDNARYIDLVNDINLSDYDFICFRNYPEQSIELDRFTRNEVVDSYFNIRENVLFENFLKSLRDAVDTGISLFVSNAQLAIDLKIVDRVEEVTDLDKLESGAVDTALGAHIRAGRYIDGSPASRLDPINPDVGAKWFDTQKNDRHRVVNTIEYLTDDATYIWTDREYYQHSDYFNWGAPDLDFRRFEYRLNGLEVGDEFYFSNSVADGKPKHLAVPFANVKSGTIVTAFADKITNEIAVEVDNPYKNFATTIALPIGTSLDGKQLGGKIFVSFTEHLSANGTNQLPEEYFAVDLATDYWLDIALENDAVTLADYTEYKTRTYEAKLAAGQISQDKYNKWAYWSYLGDNQKTFVGSDTTGLEKVIGTLFGELGAPGSKIGKSRAAIATLARRRDALGRFASNSSGGLPWARVISGRIYDTMTVFVPSINSRGLWWLTDRVRLTGKVVRTEPMIASVRSPNAVAQPDRSISINAQTMLSSAVMASNSLSADTNTVIISLPMTAEIEFPFVLKKYNALPMTASVLMRDTKQFTYSVEDVTLYVHSKEPILYVRKEMIR